MERSALGTRNSGKQYHAGSNTLRSSGGRLKSYGSQTNLAQGSPSRRKKIYQHFLLPDSPTFPLVEDNIHGVLSTPSERLGGG